VDDRLTSGPRPFTAELWAGIEGTYRSIPEHPFVSGLTDGSLERER
jgi:thiaminase